MAEVYNLFLLLNDFNPLFFEFDYLMFGINEIYLN